MSPISRFLFGVFAACGAVQAYPQQQQQWNSTSATSTTAAATPAPSQNNNDIITKLTLASTTAKKLQLLFTQDGQTLLGQDQIDKVAKFDFNDATPQGLGGATKSAVSTDQVPYLDPSIDTLYRTRIPCPIYSANLYQQPSST
jgi:hypothetical protein